MLPRKAVSKSAAGPAAQQESSDNMEKKSGPVQKIRLKIFGVGGAGGHVIGQIAAARAQGGHPLDGVDLIAINTDLQALNEISGAETLQIGGAVTHGLGAGGEPEIGARSAVNDAERIEALAQGADVVFLTAGLGGGTGAGASPTIARIAKEQGALVLAFVALPFSFEGERRKQQALSGLEQLRAQADAVICIPNDKIFRIAGAEASVVDAFKRADEIIMVGVQAIWQLLSRKGLINLDFADLRTTLGSKHCDGLFSYGEGQGNNKARDAVKALLDNPLLDSGDVLAKSEGVLVSILGGPDLTLADVQKTVEPISRLAGRAHVIMGAAIDETYRGKVMVTVIAAANILPRRLGAQSTAAKPPLPHRAVESTVPHAAPRSAVAPVPAPAVAMASVAKTAVEEAPKPEPVVAQKAPAKPKQETLPLEGVSRGRFDKSEPTLYNGEDLDVPTFLRRAVSLKR
ncbi:MAG TPA: cell division protein FtsZ [Verrucomicrobiae bacterium]|nr:cell division protein FtsZ [Verrucomicrobiae bacterium]